MSNINRCLYSDEEYQEHIEQTELILEDKIKSNLMFKQDSQISEKVGEKYTDNIIKKNNNNNVIKKKNIIRKEDISVNNSKQKYNEIIRKHNISSFFSHKLKCLHTFKIVFILDDSGSMNKVLEDSPLNKGNLKATRWNELQEFARISIEIANFFNPEGCDIYFLNRPMAKSIHMADEISSHFVDKPSGFTPITKIFSTVLKNNTASVLADKKLLIVIVTDGEPTDNEGKYSLTFVKLII